MRGSAQLVSDVSDPAALCAAWQGDVSSPVHPLGVQNRERRA
jgi:hypothetical protein